MRTYNAIIVDDEINAIRLLEANLEPLFPEITISAKCVHWSDALKMLKENVYDLLFLDISMPEKGGMELLKLIPQFTGEVIFITAHLEFAIEAIKLQAAAYILKPYTDEELSQAINTAIDKIGRKRMGKPDRGIRSEIIAVPCTQGIDYIHLSKVLYFQADNKCTKIVSNTTVLYSSYPMSKFKELIKNEDFYQVHRSYIVNLSAIKRYVSQSATIFMNDNSEIPLAKAAKDDFLDYFQRVGKN